MKWITFWSFVFFWNIVLRKSTGAVVGRDNNPGFYDFGNGTKVTFIGIDPEKTDIANWSLNTNLDTQANINIICKLNKVTFSIGEDQYNFNQLTTSCNQGHLFNIKIEACGISIQVRSGDDQWHHSKKCLHVKNFNHDSIISVDTTTNSRVKLFQCPWDGREKLCKDVPIYQPTKHCPTTDKSNLPWILMAFFAVSTTLLLIISVTSIGCYVRHLGQMHEESSPTKDRHPRLKQQLQQTSRSYPPRLTITGAGTNGSPLPFRNQHGLLMLPAPKPPRASQTKEIFNGNRSNFIGQDQSERPPPPPPPFQSKLERNADQVTQLNPETTSILEDRCNFHESINSIYSCSSF